MSFKNIYVAATSQHVGKTTTTLGLVSAFSKLGHNVGYSKPVGQKHITVNNQEVDKDTVLFADLLKFDINPDLHSPIILGKGATKRILDGLDMKPHHQKLIDANSILTKQHDIMVYEGTGHPGVGSVGQISNAKAAKLLDASVIMVAEGGIGSTIDMLNMCLSIFREEGVPILGVIINKVIPSKLEAVRKYLDVWLTQNNLNLLGVVPYDETMAYPLVWTAAKAIGADIELFRERGYQRIERIIAGSLAQINDFENSTNNLLVVAPRSIDQAIEKILAFTESSESDDTPLSGIVITGDESISDFAMKYINDHKVPLMRSQLDTYGAVVRMSRIEVKINRKTPWKITKAIELIRENTDTTKILELSKLA